MSIKEDFLSRYNATREASSIGWQRYCRFVFALSALWSPALFALVSLALRSELHSHTLLVPWVAVYVVWTARQSLPAVEPAAISLTFFFGLACLGSLAAGWVFRSQPSDGVSLAFWILGYVFAVASGGFLFLGRSVMRFCGFSFAYLLFLVPLPLTWIDWMETGLQHGSAEVADWLFIASGIPSIREGQVFRFPGLKLQIAHECSGIHSTLVLFMVSIIAGKVFLNGRLKRIVLTALIIPLGLLRNAFRVFTLASLSVYVDPRIIDSSLHHHGGPIFFLIALIPLSALLWAFYRWENRRC